RVSALVGAWRINEPLARRPGVDLVVQRYEASVVDYELGRLLQQFFPLRIVDGREPLLEQRVHLRIRIAAPIPGAKALGLVIGRNQRAQWVRRLARGDAPA